MKQNTKLFEEIEDNEFQFFDEGVWMNLVNTLEMVFYFYFYKDDFLDKTTRITLKN